jgi:glycosyltransferase involved in cell wall biosynthesis
VQALRRALREATRLIVTTTAMADRLLGLFPETGHRLDVVPMGVADTFRPAHDRIQAAKDAALLLGFDDPFLLVVGQDEPNKRHDLALAAFAEHVPEPWRLVLVQRQTRYPRLFREACRRGVAHRVSWFPQLALENLVTLYCAADALIQPSCYEGFGLPVLEAMACGCPVVATDLAVFREVIGNAGLLVAPDDVPGFGHAIAGLLQSPGRREALSQAGLERAQKFSWDNCARQTMEVLYRAAGVAAPFSHRQLKLHPVAA